LQLSEQEVKSVLDIYWDKIRKTLSSLEHNKVFLKGLGTFYIKTWSLEKRLKINENKVSNCMENPSASGLQMMNDIFKENIKLNAVKQRDMVQNRIKSRKRDERRNQDLEGEG
jgi:hypothetical protein